MLIDVEHKIRLNYVGMTAEEWGAYSEMDGVDDITMKVNEALKEYVNAGLERFEVKYNMQDVFRYYSKFGFYDGESNEVLDHVLNKIYLTKF